MSRCRRSASRCRGRRSISETKVGKAGPRYVAALASTMEPPRVDTCSPARLIHDALAAHRHRHDPRSAEELWDDRAEPSPAFDAPALARTAHGSSPPFRCARNCVTPSSNASRQGAGALSTRRSLHNPKVVAKKFGLSLAGVGLKVACDNLSAFNSEAVITTRVPGAYEATGRPDRDVAWVSDLSVGAPSLRT